MVENASFSENDIPICPSTSREIPKKIITYSEALTIYHSSIKKEPKFYSDAFVCFYCDDNRFDGKNGIWANPRKAYGILNHFGGIICPDFSTYLDFPIPLKVWNTYRMNAFGYWYGTICKKKVINNARWGTEETFHYCFDGIRDGDIVAIGTVGSGLNSIINRPIFENGLRKLIVEKHIRFLIIYGSTRDPIFSELKKIGVVIMPFEATTSASYKKWRYKHEQAIKL